MPENQTSSRTTGILLVAISAVTFGTLAISSRYALDDGMDTLTIMFLRFSLATVCMLALLALRHERLPRGSALLRLVGMGAVGYTLQAYCFITALEYASSGLVELLLYIYPALVTGLSIVILKEKPSRRALVALALALLGTALVVSPAGGRWQGIVLALLAAGIYSIYILVGAQVMKQVSAIQSSTVIFASAAVSAGLLMLIGGPHPPQSTLGWGAMAAIVIFATVIPVTTFLAGIGRVGPSTASMLSTFEPVVTVLLAAWLFGEVLAPVVLLGGALILAAVLLLAYGERKPAPAS